MLECKVQKVDKGLDEVFSVKLKDEKWTVEMRYGNGTLLPSQVLYHLLKGPFHHLTIDEIHEVIDTAYDFIQREEKK